MLQSMGYQRVRHELMTKQQQYVPIGQVSHIQENRPHMCYTVPTFQVNKTRACRSIRNMTGKEVKCF